MITGRYADMSQLAVDEQFVPEEFPSAYRDEMTYDQTLEVLDDMGADDNVTTAEAAFIRCLIGKGTTPETIAHRLIRQRHWLTR
jgi:hypothetical protein